MVALLSLTRARRCEALLLGVVIIALWPAEVVAESAEPSCQPPFNATPACKPLLDSGKGVWSENKCKTRCDCGLLKQEAGKGPEQGYCDPQCDQFCNVECSCATPAKTPAPSAGSPGDGKACADTAAKVADLESKLTAANQKVSDLESSKEALQRLQKQLKDKAAADKHSKDAAGEDLKKAEEKIKKMNESLQEITDLYSDSDLQKWLAKNAEKVETDNTTVFQIRGRKQSHVMKEARGWLQFHLEQQIGDEGVRAWLPVLSGVLAYGLLACPLMGACCITGVICAQEAWLRFFHIYFGLASVVTGAFAICLRGDPLHRLAKEDDSSYLLVQGMLCMVFSTYGTFLMLGCCCSSIQCRKLESRLRTAQLFLACGIGAAYYGIFWRPMGRGDGNVQPRHVIWPWLEYWLASGLFFVLLSIERMIWSFRRQGAGTSGGTSKQEMANLIGFARSDDDDV